tara:strand:- start:325 stop:504 length:180 start_codon:yes stop_codon:yes gene_type:complete
MANQAISTVDNLSVSIVTGALGFMATNWIQIGLFVFAAVHAYIAIEKWLYEKSLRDKVE